MDRRVLLGSLVCLLAISGCSSSVPSQGAASDSASAPAPTGTSTTSTPPNRTEVENDSTSASWANVGVDRGTPTGPSFLPPTITGDVDVLAPGTYTFTGGPVPGNADVSVASVSFPPDAARTLTIGHVSRPRLEATDNHWIVRFTVDVTAVSAPYLGLRAWVL